MTNREISAIFSRIADILEIKEENVFRIRAYRVAAQNITALSRQLTDIYKEDTAGLGNIPGIGKDLKEKIIEMLETGRLLYYDDLIKEFPPGFLDMLNLAGLGPKKLKKLKSELKIKNVDDLESACKKGKLEHIEGMGIKTQDKLLAAIKYFRKKQGRMLLHEADIFADEIILYLSKSENFKRIEKAGSLRRGKDTIGDLDILAVAKDSQKAMDYFIEIPGIETVIAKGPTKSSISIKEGPQVDLRVIDEASFGAALIYFTGSKQHNIKIRTRAKAKGYKVNEYGVYKINPTGKESFVAGKTEEDVYRKLGMQWISPELREDQGEVEAALENILPKSLLTLRDIKGDLHVHTQETDGHDTLEAMIMAAKKKGYEYIAITDHSKHVRIANGMDEKRLLKHVENIRKLAKRTKNIKILAGIEVDILENGELDLKDFALKELDIVVAAVHSRFQLDKKKQTNRMLRALENKYVNILAHPSGRLITSRSGIEADFDKIFKKAAEKDIFLEINTHGERIDLNDAHSRRAKEMGARFAINTDAHAAEQMDEMKYGVITARRGWLEKKDVLNTYSYEKLIKALK
ncbi:MAG: DNA polymerase/3'-5' exonuclease PolX [Candidatus Omnitrophota bacterium]